MGHHRRLPYIGLHFSNKAPRPGFLFSTLVVVGSLLAAVALLTAVYTAALGIGIPVRVTADGTPLHIALLSMAKTL